MRGQTVGVAVLLCCAACNRAPDPQRVLIQSEVAIDKVVSFRAHIETHTFGVITTDAEYECDRSLAHYVESNERLNRRIEYILAGGTRFTRQLSDPVSNWSHDQNAFWTVCDRLKQGGQDAGPERILNAQDGRLLPPFFYYANESGAEIVRIGRESFNGVDCEVWRVKDRVHAFPLHTIWIGVADRLPRKYIEGEPENPQGVVTYSDYGERFGLDVPNGSN